VIDTLLVIAKAPAPGRVKTRLVPPLNHSQAAEVARAALADTLHTASRVPAREHLVALDGPPGAWLPGGWRAVPQGGGGLDLRLSAAFAAARGPAVLVGMDTPQLSPDQLSEFDPVRYDACLGPARDGGFWAIGFADPQQAAVVIPGVPMSTPDTGMEQLRRMRAAGLRVQLLETIDDVDTFEDALTIAAECRFGEFTRIMQSLVAAA
jgi:glycosyltransferase A (GT-A) superfamily protein (DUF2064 family)